MKKSELFFSALRIPVDYCMIMLAGIIAFLIRRTESVQEIKPILYQFTIRDYTEMLFVVASFFILVYAIDGLYNIRSTKRTLREIYRVFRATTIAIMFIIIFLFLNPDLFSSRFVILLAGFLIVSFVSLGRIMLGFFQRYLLIKRKIGVHRLLLVGGNGFCSTLRREIKNRNKLGYEIIDHIEDVDLERIKKIKKIKGIDEIIECSSKLKKTKLLKLKEYCIQNRIVFKYIPTLIQTSNFDISIFLGEPLIEIKNTPLDGWGKILKRAFDIVGSIFGILIFGIPMLIVYVVTYFESGRPIIYYNRRVGHKREFDLYKFRYMKHEYTHGKQYSKAHNEKALKFLERLIEKQSIKKGPLYKIKDDPRKTKWGAFLERYSIDEFPQFFNVLKGEMSLVGPRPHQPIEVEKYANYARRVLTIKPGITGLAQISGRSDLSFEDEVKLDIYYIENWSLWKDVKTILMTIPTLFRIRKN